MWRSIMASGWASWVVGKVSVPKERTLQLEMDLQKLYIVSQLYKAGARGRPPNTAQLVLESKALELSSLRSDVEEHLRQQVVGVAEVLHSALQQAGDPCTPARRMEAAYRRLQRRTHEEQQSGLSKLISGVTGSRPPPPPPPPPPRPRAPGSTPSAPQQPAHAAAQQQTQGSQPTHGSVGAAAGGPAGDGAGAGAGAGMSARELGAALSRHTGFSLELRPSSVQHPEAGTGLFVRGEARAGSVVALFPGVVYGRTQLSCMPNYPKVDTNNPFLSVRYDQSIVDSKPWARGDPGVGPSGSGQADSGGGGRGAAAGAAAAAAGGGRGAAAGLQGGAAGVGCSGGGGGEPWWVWCGPLCSALGRLEGRHPLALAHFVNHPGRGQTANVLEASLDLPLDHPDLDMQARPWLRAYLPVVQPPTGYDPYGKEGEPDDGSDDDSDDEADADEAAPPAAAASASGSGGQGAAARGPRRRRGPGELSAAEVLSPPDGVVRVLALVATRAIKDGEEVLQNYRMSPHVARPEWYVVHDAEAEQRKWAKIRSLDLGFKGARSTGGQQGAG